MKRYSAFLIIALVLIIAVVAGAIFIKSASDRETISSAPTVPEPSPGLRTLITLEEFGDYQCPPCGQLHPTLKDLKREFGSNLNLVFRNLPLSSIHKNALVAARAAEAARMQNRFWEMHDLLYENQSLWAEDNNPKNHFRKFATDLGLDMARFDSDMEGDQVRFRIEADQDAAARLGIDGTPTILINGRQVRPEATNPDGIRKGIEVVASRQQKGAGAPTEPGR